MSFISVFSMTETKACDACGCSLGGYSLGFIPQQNSSFVGLRYSRAHFYAEMLHGSNHEFSEDTYQRVELIWRHVWKNRWQVNVMLPYLYNRMDGNQHDLIKLSGFGDPVFMLNYKVIDQMLVEKNFRQNLWIGAGVKAPLGKFDAVDRAELINPNFQLGSGSWDALLHLNYIAQVKSFGVNIEATGKINTPNSMDYQFGNQGSVTTNLFHTQLVKGHSIAPYLGTYFEYGEFHRFEGFKEVNTGGRASFANVGLQWQKDRCLFNAQYQLPIWQDFNSDRDVNIESKGRLAFTFIALIGKI